MPKPHDDSKACRTAFVQDNTLVAVIEMSLSSWLVAGLIPRVSREPLKKIARNAEDRIHGRGQRVSDKSSGARVWLANRRSRTKLLFLPTKNLGPYRFGA